MGTKNKRQNRSKETFENPTNALIKRAGKGKGIVLPPGPTAEVAGIIIGLRVRIDSMEGMVAEYQRLLAEKAAEDELELLEDDEEETTEDEPDSETA
jgi:hypothetical protein